MDHWRNDWNHMECTHKIWNFIFHHLFWWLQPNCARNPSIKQKPPPNPKSVKFSHMPWPVFEPGQWWENKKIPSFLSIKGLWISSTIFYLYLSFSSCCLWCPAGISCTCYVSTAAWAGRHIAPGTLDMSTRPPCFHSLYLKNTSENQHWEIVWNKRVSCIHF